MATLGDLERAVMELMWSGGEQLTAYDLQARLERKSDPAKPLAVTTVLTVLSRLEKKGFVERQRSRRPHLYRAAASREQYMAELMHDVLGSATDRAAVLERFVGQVTHEEADTMRRILDGR